MTKVFENMQHPYKRTHAVSRLTQNHRSGVLQKIILQQRQEIEVLYVPASGIGMGGMRIETLTTTNEMRENRRRHLQGTCHRVPSLTEVVRYEYVLIRIDPVLAHGQHITGHQGPIGTRGRLQPQRLPDNRTIMPYSSPSVPKMTASYQL